MAVGGDQGIFEWAISGVTTAVVGALGYLARTEAAGRAKLSGDIDKLTKDAGEIRKEYVRRDDLAMVMDSYRRGHDELLKEVHGVREHVHTIANSVAMMRGRSET